MKVVKKEIQFDEISPHLHIVGVPITNDCKRYGKLADFLIFYKNYLKKFFML